MRGNSRLALAFHTLFIIFILAPLVLVCLVAFTSKGYLSLPTDGLSLRWFYAILDNDEFIAAFWTSLYLALASASLALALAIPAALALARYRFPGREAVTGFFLSPLMIPHVVLGVSFLRFFGQVGLTGTFIGLVFAHVIIIMPYALRLVLAAVTGLDRDAERAALSLGASQWTAFRRITLPLIIPGITGGWILAFITSFDEVTMTVFVASPSTMTLPVRMYHHIAQTIDPLLASVSAVLIAITLVFMLVLDRLYGLDKVLIGRG
ncbi:MAG: ABC transporter permease [Candidatus Competibacterales bacterium]|nr:ABC transporter permease [Candidatus Competibacterales bacterium]